MDVGTIIGAIAKALPSLVDWLIKLIAEHRATHPEKPHSFADDAEQAALKAKLLELHAAL